jgi:hypothetical protein
MRRRGDAGGNLRDEGVAADLLQQTTLHQLVADGHEVDGPAPLPQAGNGIEKHLVFFEVQGRSVHVAHDLGDAIAVEHHAGEQRGLGLEVVGQQAVEAGVGCDHGFSRRG